VITYEAELAVMWLRAGGRREHNVRCQTRIAGFSEATRERRLRTQLPPVSQLATYRAVADTPGTPL
jgi:hypothetical protein